MKVEILVLVGVAAAAGVGAMVRAFADRWLSAVTPYQRLPWATLGVNTAGSLFLGVVFALGEPAPGGGDPLLSAAWLSVLGTGFAGGLTTFSTFTWEMFALMREARERAAGLYVLMSVLLGLLAFGVGVMTAEAIVDPGRLCLFRC